MPSRFLTVLKHPRWQTASAILLIWVAGVSACVVTLRRLIYTPPWFEHLGYILLVLWSGLVYPHPEASLHDGSNAFPGAWAPVAAVIQWILVAAVFGVVLRRTRRWLQVTLAPVAIIIAGIGIGLVASSILGLSIELVP